MKNLIIAISLLITTVASADTIPLGATTPFVFTASEAEYSVNGYDDTTGDWSISISLILVAPEGVSGEVRLSVRSSYNCVVMAGELATYFGVEAGTVSETKTGSEISAAVRAIAFAKTMAAYGVGQ